MFKHVLVPTDGSPLSERSALGAIALAKALSARVTAIGVSEPFHVFSANPAMVEDTADTYRKDCEKRAAAHLDAVAKAAAAAGVACDTIHVFDQHAYAAIIEAADDRGCGRDSPGIAWPHRAGGDVPRQRDGRSADALAHTRRRMAVSL